MSDIYCQLIPNDDEQDLFYQVMPRMGAFEVSVNGVVRTPVIDFKYFECTSFYSEDIHKQIYPLQRAKSDQFFFVQLVFSKCLSGLWPHYDAIGQRCAEISDALKSDPNCDLTNYQTTGKVKAQSRKKKPVTETKLPAHMQSQKGAPAKKAGAPP